MGRDGTPGRPQAPRKFPNASDVSQVWATQYAQNGTEIPGARRMLTCSSESNNYPAVAFNGGFAGVVVARGKSYFAQKLVFLGFNPK